MPHVSILMATYNGEHYIKEQLDSLISQTYSEFCCYIHDDGSTDRTKLIIKEYVERYPDKIQELEYGPQGGAAANFMSMLSKVEDEFYMFCDQDDVWTSDKIGEEVRAITSETDNTPILVHSDMEVVDQSLTLIHASYHKLKQKNPQENNLRDLLLNNKCAGCSMLINKKLRDIAISYSNISNIWMHDWWCALIAAAVGRIIYVDKPLVKYRQHRNNQVGASVNKIKWFSKKLRNVVEKKQIRSSLQGIFIQRKIALELSRINGLSEDDYNFLVSLATIENKGKIERILFYYKNTLLNRDIKNYWKILIV